MNMAVSFLAFINFRQNVRFPKKLFITLIIFSVSAAYLGGTLLVDMGLHKQILGVLLLFPIIRFLKLFPHSILLKVEEKLCISFIFGLIGMGKGTILRLILLMLGWIDLRETAVVSALFIFLNSLNGYFWVAAWGVSIDDVIWSLTSLTVLAGVAGAYFGAKRFNLQTLRYLLTAVLAFAVVKLITA